MTKEVAVVQMIEKLGSSGATLDDIIAKVDQLVDAVNALSLAEGLNSVTIDGILNRLNQ